MLNAMVDIETLGVRSDSAVLSVGIAMFDETQVLDTMGWAIDITRIKDGHIDLSTVKWWMDKDPAVREFSMGGKFSPGQVAFNFKTTLNGAEEFWANDPQFDFVILENWFRRLNAQPQEYEHGFDLKPGTFPIHYQKMRSYRTIIGEAKRHGFNPQDHWQMYAAHNPIDDAANQARLVIAARQWMDNMMGQNSANQR